MRFFDQDSGFNKYGSIIFDLIILNFMVAIITLFTLGIGFGASITAMIFSIDRTLFEGNGYAFKNFLKSFKQNWKQATVIWFISAALIAFGQFSATVLGQAQGIFSVFAFVHLALIVEIVFILIYTFPTLALIEVDTKTLITNSFVLAHKHLVSSLTCFVIITCGVYLTLELHGLLILFLISGLGVLINQIVVRKVLMQYFTEEQKQTLFKNTMYTPKDSDY